MPSDGKSSLCLWQGELKKYFIDWQHHSYQDSWNHCQSQTIISRIMHYNFYRKNIMTRWSPYLACITHLVIHEVFGLKKVCKINPLLLSMQGSMLIIVLYRFPSWIFDQNKKSIIGKGLSNDNFVYILFPYDSMLKVLWLRLQPSWISDSQNNFKIFWRTI